MYAGQFCVVAIHLGMTFKYVRVDKLLIVHRYKYRYLLLYTNLSSTTPTAVNYKLSCVQDIYKECMHFTLILALVTP